MYQSLIFKNPRIQVIVKAYAIISVVTKASEEKYIGFLRKENRQRKESKFHLYILMCELFS